MPLTTQEQVFCDHYDYEGTHSPYEESIPVPARNWMRAYRVQERDIENILRVRRRDREDSMLPEKPIEPFAPAWKTADEARRRNQDLAEEANDARPTGSPTLGEE
jgi:hypothetical protein